MSVLHKVEGSELEAVKTWLESYLPEAWALYYLVRHVVSGRWSGESFYTLGWPAIHGVVTGQVEQGHPCEDYRVMNNTIFLYAATDEDVHVILNLEEFIDWSKPDFSIKAIPRWISRAVEQFAKARGVNKWENLTFVDTFRARPGDVTVRPPPRPFKVRPVKTDSEIDYCASTWDHRRPLSDQYCRALVQRLPSICVADEHDTCLSFEIGKEFGSIGLLYTKETNRGQGLAKVVVSHLAEEFRKLDLDVYATVVVGNESSFKLHQSLGFKHMEDLDIVYVRYKNPQEEN